MSLLLAADAQNASQTAAPAPPPGAAPAAPARRSSVTRMDGPGAGSASAQVPLSKLLEQALVHAALSKLLQICVTKPLRPEAGEARYERSLGLVLARISLPQGPASLPSEPFRRLTLEPHPSSACAWLQSAARLIDCLFRDRSSVIALSTAAVNAGGFRFLSDLIASLRPGNRLGLTDGPLSADGGRDPNDLVASSNAAEVCATEVRTIRSHTQADCAFHLPCGRRL